MVSISKFPHTTTICYPQEKDRLDLFLRIGIFDRVGYNHTVEMRPTLLAINLRVIKPLDNGKSHVVGKIIIKKVGISRFFPTRVFEINLRLDNT